MVVKVVPNESMSLTGNIVKGDRDLINDKLIHLKKPKKIFLSSFGGSVIESAKIYLLLENKFIFLAGENIDSAALIIFLAGEKRMAQKNTKFLFHNLIFKNYETYEENLKQKKRFIQLISLRTKLSPEKIKKLMDNEIELNAITAQQYGIIHKII